MSFFNVLRWTLEFKHKYAMQMDTKVSFELHLLVIHSTFSRLVCVCVFFCSKNDANQFETFMKKIILKCSLFARAGCD